MKLNPIKANMTELDLSGALILFSYKTPVAMMKIDGGVYRTSRFWSATTSRHINKWLSDFDMDKKAQEKPQEFFDNLVAAVK